MIFEFDTALVRDPASTVVNGLTSQSGPRAEFPTVLQEHAAYVQALTECGLSVERLPPLEEFPDSIFVEDPALVFSDAAILLRPGAPSRLGEGEHLDDVLSRRFGRVLRMQQGFADGGDMLLTPAGMFIGLSKRTNHAGATELSRLLRELGIAARIVDTPATTLHLKSDCSLIGEDHMLCTSGLAVAGLFEGYRQLIVPDSEKPAANALRLNDTLLVGDRFPRTLELLTSHGYHVRPMPTTHIGRLDAGLSCMSLRWKARRA